MTVHTSVKKKEKVSLCLIGPSRTDALIEDKMSSTDKKKTNDNVHPDTLVLMERKTDWFISLLAVPVFSIFQPLYCKRRHKSSMWLSTSGPVIASPPLPPHLFPYCHTIGVFNHFYSSLLHSTWQLLTEDVSYIYSIRITAWLTDNFHKLEAAEINEWWMMNSLY